MTSIALPEPEDELSDPTELLLRYLDYYRSVIARKLDGLSDAQLRSSPLPSGWTPLELLKHLVYMERRWMCWGFAGEQVDEPWGDRGEDGAWRVAREESVAELVARMHAGGEETTAIVRRADLADRSATGGRFAAGASRPALAWVLFHVLQEYARHAGHLDIVRELADGEVGE